MANKNSSKDELRTKVEARLEKMLDPRTGLSMKDATTLLHELEVHQVKLEMQNQELLETQRRLEEVRDQYTSLFDFAPVGYLVLNEKGIIENINLTGCDLLGTERSSLKGKPLSAFTSKESSNMLFLKLKDAFKTGLLPPVEVQMEPKSGNPFTALLHGAVSEDENRPIRECRLSMQDFSAFKKSETLKKEYEDLQKEKQSIEEYLKLAPVIFLMLDRENKVQMINQKGCDLLGFDRQEIEGESWFGNFLENGEKNTEGSFDYEPNYHNLILPPYFESKVRCKNGQLRLIAWSNTTLLDISGNIIGSLSAGEDITERNKEETSKRHYTEGLKEIIKERTKELSDALESEKKINEMKTNFVSVASHELRTPITIVMSSIALIERYNEQGKYDREKPHIARIKSSAKHFANILDDFLSIDKLEKGMVRVHKEPFDLKQFIGGILEEMEGMLKEGQRINYEHKGNTEVVQDRRLLRHVILNLLSNATKFSDDNVDIKTTLEHGQITASILDKGIGIPEEEQRHLFKRFFRAKNAVHIQGTGLGLGIVQRYLRLMGGTISFTSKLDWGSIFTFTIKGD